MAFSFNKVCSNTIPAGTYKVQISDIKFKTSGTATSGNDMVVHYVIVDGPYAKRTLIDTLYEKAFSFRLRPFLKAVGVDMNREFSTARELYEYGIKEATGKTLMVTVTIRTYNGNEYNNITDFIPLPGSTTSEEDVLAEFATPATTPEHPTVADASLPFEKDDPEDTTSPFSAEVAPEDSFF